LDYVIPTPHHGNTWGLGGTCVNVGCIPKKLFHANAIFREELYKRSPNGFTPNPESEALDFKANTIAVQTYIKRSNFDYKSKLLQDEITYLNAYGSILDSNTVLFSPEPQQVWNFAKEGAVTPEIQDQVGLLKTENIVISVGGRPWIPSETDLPGAKYAITSDDVFFLEDLPKRTLVYGGGYIACETAGF
jgi:pyruvate/2-oxoglutarate dehydrogenase complex dihydrolipoamide dehydrogenase (E3) component